MSAAASLSVTSGLPLGVGIGWSNRRFHPQSATGLDRLAQPLHRELNVFGLKVAPALSLCEIAVFRERSKYSAASFLAALRAVSIFHQQSFCGHAADTKI